MRHLHDFSTNNGTGAYILFKIKVSTLKQDKNIVLVVQLIIVIFAWGQATCLNYENNILSIHLVQT